MVLSDTTAGKQAAQTATFAIILALAFSHMLNDVMQSLLAAIYPMLKADFHLAFWQIGLLTMAFQVTASLLQPAVGLYTDRRPMPHSLAFGMGSTFFGLILLAYAGQYWLLIAGACFIGFGSAVFHPEASRIARLASGGRYGMAQSVFQIGGNAGTAIGPLLAAFIVVPNGQASVAWFSVIALVGMAVLWQVGNWYSRERNEAAKLAADGPIFRLPRRTVVIALLALVALTFSKHVYVVSLSSYYTFFVIEKFGVSVQASQLLLFLFLGASAAGLILGGLVSDRIGARTVIWFSILGALPFTLVLPHVGLAATAVLSVVIGTVMASAFPAIVVFAQELVPGRVGMIAGLFFGLAFGLAGLGAAVLGVVADFRGIGFVYTVCSFLPLIGLAAIFLPSHAAMRRGETAA
jgi:FSR family fosmidomycin resistance protein-like MFS transporter